MYQEHRPNQHSVEFPKEQPKAEIPFIIFCSFLCTFLVARLVVAGLYGGWLKVGGFLHVGGTHVHHLNYGIFLLSVVGFMSLTAYGHGFRRTLAVLYGFALGLTFDEFGMWLKLEDHYYNSLSYDAIIVIASLFALMSSYGAYADRATKRKSSRVQVIPEGTVLFNEGDKIDDAFLVVEGKVQVYRDGPSGRQILGEIGENEFVGEMALFTDHSRSASAMALTPLKVKLLTKKSLLYNLDHHPELGVQLIRVLASRLLVANDLIKNR